MCNFQNIQLSKFESKPKKKKKKRSKKHDGVSEYVNSTKAKKSSSRRLLITVTACEFYRETMKSTQP